VSRSGRHEEFVQASGEMSPPEFTTFLTDSLRASTAMVRPGAIQYVFMDWRHMRELLAAGDTCGLELKNLVIWNKGAGAMGSFLRSQHELVFQFKEPNGPATNNVQLGKFGRNRTNVWDWAGAPSLRKELALHPSPKPVSMIAEAIRDCSDRGDIVLDSFSGSGTTIIAAAKTGRRGYAIDLDPHYVDVGVTRWQAWSGQTARHRATGCTFAELAERRSSERDPPQARSRTRPQTKSGASAA
jgi:DNA modification methylase